MNEFDKINDQYVSRIKNEEVLSIYAKKIDEEQKNLHLSAIERASKSMAYLYALLQEIDCRNYVLLRDSVTIGNRYFFCIDAINNYKATLLKGGMNSIATVSSEMKNVVDAEEVYEKTKDSFLEEHGIQVDSIDVLNSVIVQGVENAISIEQKAIEQLKSDAEELANREYTIELKLTDLIQREDALPEEMLVARYPVQQVTQAVLRDIGINSTYRNITVNLHNQGNIIVKTDFKYMENEQIDAFVIAYILRFIETFPLGAVNIHIFDQNTNYLYKRLINNFQNESAGENVKKMVQIHTSLSDLSVFKGVICEDIFNKTTVDKPDLYAVYENDTTDPFNLIIIRDGLVDSSGYVSSDFLDTINSLTRPGDLGHRCGLRFLIIDNSSSFTKNLTATNKHLVSSIEANCELKLNYLDGRFTTAEKDIEVLGIQDNLDMYVQERSKAIADAIGKREKSYISLDDVSADAIDENLGNIMYIPVGMSGGMTVELPLSCKDEGGTVAGQCIGYMAIGQSGSGKSSFFHSIVLNGCMKYLPKDLQFWLLDFKNGGASSKYSRCGIPHIRIIAENNKIDDALCLFQMVLEEMERRSKAFNDYFTDNIIEYNKIAKKEGLEYFPRIIIAIDEVQEIFREDNASVIQKLISSISTRMRSAGMHFVMVAQNLSEGKSYMLKDAFLPSATGRICFRVAQDIPRDSGFDEDYIDRRQEISELKTGEAYVSYGKGTIKKVKMAFISPQDMSEKYFASICERYSGYANMRPWVIGSKKRLVITVSQQGTNTSYAEIIGKIKNRNDIYRAVIGEDAYRMKPLNILFSQHENSSVLFLGSDKSIASSLCASTALSLMRQNVKIHLFDGDRTKVQEGAEFLQHPFMYLCQYVSATGGLAENHRLNQLKDVMRDLYAEYLDRQDQVQKAEFEAPTFSPVFLIINDLFGIESFSSNDMIENETSDILVKSVTSRGFNFDYDLFSQEEPMAKKEAGNFRENIQNIMSTLLKNGYRYNLYVVLAIKGNPAIWRNAHIASEINNVVLFNDTEYADQIENAYYLKEMLKNISNVGGEETMAVWSGKKTFSKVRPVIYKLSVESEKNVVDNLIKGEQI